MQEPEGYIVGAQALGILDLVNTMEGDSHDYYQEEDQIPLVWFRDSIDHPAMEIENEGRFFNQLYQMGYGYESDGHTDLEEGSTITLSDGGFEEMTCSFYSVIPEDIKGIFLVDGGHLDSMVENLRQDEEEGRFRINGSVLSSLLEEFPDLFDKLGFLNIVVQTKYWFDNGDLPDEEEMGEGVMENFSFYHQDHPTGNHTSYLSELNIVDFHHAINAIIKGVSDEKFVGTLHTFLYSAFQDHSFDIYLEDFFIKGLFVVEAYEHIMWFLGDLGTSAKFLSSGATGERLGIPSFYDPDLTPRSELKSTNGLLNALRYAVANPNTLKTWCDLSELVTEMLYRLDACKINSINDVLARQDQLTEDDLLDLKKLTVSFIRLQLVCDLMIRVVGV